MRKNKKYNWPELLTEFETSGLTQTQYCKERDINPRYFSQQRSKHLKKTAKSKFQKVKVEDTLANQATGLTIEVGRCKVQCPASLPLNTLIQLVHSLA